MECSTLSVGRSYRATPSRRRRSPTSSLWPRDRRSGPVPIELSPLKRVELERYILLRVIRGLSAIRPVELLTLRRCPSHHRSLTRAAQILYRARRHAAHYATIRMPTRAVP